MGWLTPEEQLEVKKKYHMLALYKCDYCGNPISILEMPVIDPKKGYHKWNKDRTPQGCRSFHTREPKVTYHQGYCNDERLGRKHKQKEKYMSKKDKKSKKKVKKVAKKVVKGDPKVMKAIVKIIELKPNHYAKRRLVKKLSEKFEKPDIRAALTALWNEKTTRKKDGKYYIVEDKPAKKDKPEKKSKKSKSKKDSSDSSDSDE